MVVAFAAALVDLKQHLRFYPRNGDAAVAGRRVENAAQKVDIGLRDDAGLKHVARAQGPRAAEHGLLDLLKGETHKALWRPTGLVEHIDEQLKLGLAVDSPLPGDALDQPLRVLGSKVAPRLGLLDKIIRDGLNKAVGPSRILHGTSRVQGKDDVGFL